MKKSYVWLIAILGMATAWTGCSKDNGNGIDTPTPQEEQVEIMAKSKALTLNVTTKAPFEGTIGEDSELTARVLVSTTEGDYSDTHTDGTMIFADNGETAVGFETGFDGNKFFPGNDDIYLVGLYPVTTATIADGAVAYTIDGKSDIMFAGEEETSKNAETAPTLAFTHLLTKLNIFAVTADDATAEAWGDIIELTITERNVAAITLADGTVDFGEDTGSISFYDITGDEAVSDENALSITVVPEEQEEGNEVEAEVIAYSLVTPIELAQEETYTLLLKTATSGEEAISVPITITPSDEDIDSTAGYYFDITLTFKGTEITATATVTDWVAGGTGAGTIE
ncbi:fimbrillin family protein [Parabacteroides sp. PF5-6]|uniref:fimbrillin family protein n=1 Tax=Parabacteroides sp. PF5-6 TaxID=1742403 RepID=UPI00240720A3|nr:fimbrillin family protein [Parabacteroides sp. PF5-6]MDF9829914.1 hypothetical protein [Parabacteroides sp. PF5-6]